MMQKKQCIILLSIMLFVLYSCTDRHPPIAEAKMRAILWDMHIAEVKAVLDDSTKNLSKEKDLAVLEKEYAVIFKHHAISKEIFDKALNWYFKNPATFDSIYKVMIEETDSLEKKLGKASEVKSESKDSITTEEMEKERKSMLNTPRLPNRDTSIKAPQKTRPEKMESSATEV